MPTLLGSLRVTTIVLYVLFLTRILKTTAIPFILQNRPEKVIPWFVRQRFPLSSIKGTHLPILLSVNKLVGYGILLASEDNHGSHLSTLRGVYYR